MTRLFSLLSFFLAWSVAFGFAPSTTSLPRTSSSLRMSDEVGGPEEQHPLPMALKMAGVLAIKTAKDVVNYPPKLLDNALRESQHTELPQTSPVVMLAKLMGVLIFKTVHDAVYYPKIWTERMIECQSLEECKLED